MNHYQKIYPIILVLFCLLPGILHAQVGVNTTGADPDPSAMLDVSSTDKGMLIPRMTSAQRTTITNPATGLLVFDSVTSSFWFFNGSVWEEVGTDNLGNHTATEVLSLNGNYLSGDGDTEGIFVDTDGDVGIGTNSPATALDINGTATVDTVAFSDGTIQTTAPKTYSVGDFAQGGIVFWVDESGQHGLVCAKSDQSTGVRWDAGTNGRTQALGTGVYAGKMNTLLIIAGHVAIGDDNNPYAARICAELEITEGGVAYGDWYLPSIKELSLMYDNKSTINATAIANGGSSFTTDQYWSSEEDVHVSRFGGGLQYMARNFYFDNFGGDGSIIKSGHNRVRAVRAF